MAFSLRDEVFLWILMKSRFSSQENPASERGEVAECIQNLPAYGALMQNEEIFEYSKEILEILKRVVKEIKKFLSSFVSFWMSFVSASQS